MNFIENHYLDMQQEDQNNVPTQGAVGVKEKLLFFGIFIFKSSFVLILWLWTWITIPLYYIIQKPWKRQQLKNKVWTCRVDLGALVGSTNNQEITYRSINVTY